MTMGKDREIRRDQAGVGPDPAESRRRLISIDDLDGYRVAEGEPDIRGWEVTTLNGRELGSVGDLLVDPERGEVVMVEVEMRGDGVHAEVPLRHVQLDRKRNVVIVDSGDLEGGNRYEARARERMADADREHFRSTYGNNPRDVRYADSRDERMAVEREADTREERVARDRDTDRDDNVEERVVERRPVIEEVVIRRRVVDED
jgi:sporulation protein YlmC with PRC-barrel domain